MGRPKGRLPTKRSCKVEYSVDKRIYALRACIECFFNKLKNHRRIATRYDQTSANFPAFVLLGYIRIWPRLSLRLTPRLLRFYQVGR